MITYVAVITFIMCTATVLGWLSKLEVSRFIPSTLFLAALWTIFFGMFDKLLLGAQLLIPLSVLGFIIFGIKLKKFSSMTDFAKTNISLPIVFFISVSAWMFIHSQQMQFSEWDEFTHWGPAVKSMFLFDQLGILSPIALNNPNYPPSLSVISYLVVKIGGTWDEADVFWAYQLIYLALIIPIINFFQLKKIFFFFIATLISVLSSLYFYNVFQSIYADALLSLVFGHTLILASKSDTQKNLWLRFNFLLSISFLVLIKDFGIVLALVSICVYGFCLISNIDSQFGLKLNSFKIPIKRAMVAMLTALGTRFSWSYFVNMGDLSKGTAGAIGGSSSRFSALFDTSNYYYQELISIIATRIHSGTITWRNGIQFSATQWLLAMTFLFLLLLWQEQNFRTKVREVFLWLILIFGFGVYIILIFLAYLTMFPPSYGVSLPSFERYIGSYLGGMLFFLTAKFIDQLCSFSNDLDENVNYADKPKLRLPVATITFTLFMLVHSPAGFALNYFYTPNQLSDGVRGNFQNIKEKISVAQFTVEDRIGIIAQHTQGFEYYVLQYEVIPASVVQTGFYTWSIGSPSDPGDLWTDQTITPEKWNQHLSKLDFLIVYKVTDSFLQEFGMFFEDPESTREQGIYRVVHDGPRNKLVKYV